MDFLKIMFKSKRITIEQLQLLVDKGTITQIQYEEIIK